MVYRRNLGALGKAFQPTVQAYPMPGSVGGVNALDSLMAMPQQDCIYTYNLMPVEYGMRLRKGYRDWAIGCKEDPQRSADQDIKTLIAYESQVQDPANDRLFAVTSEGIWNVSNFNTTAPVQDVVFTQTQVESGYGVYVEYTNDAEKHFMFYADALNGLHQYEEGIGWSVPPSGIGDTDWYFVDVILNPVEPNRVAFNVDNIAFVMIHKLRMWVILEDSDDAWYLPLFSTSGELKKFTFGSKLTHGGNLMGLWNWTVDGGDGVDDYLIAVSRGGDIALYRGADPEAPDWGTTGTWFIGETPESRRIVASHGSELYLLSTYGVTSIRDLLQGSVANDLRTSPSAKVNRFLRADVESGKDELEWALNIHPADGFMQIVTPEPGNSPFIQYNQNSTTKAWGFWEGVPMKCGQTWNGDYFMGGKAGKVYIYDGVLDGTTIHGVDQFVANAFDGVPAVNWTQPVPAVNDYLCTPVPNLSSANVLIPFTSVVTVLYQVTYTVITSTPAIAHGVFFGRATQVPVNVGAGVFTDVLTANAVSDLVTLVGDTNFDGTISDIVIRLAPLLGQAVSYRMLTSFQSPDNHAQFKRVGFVRTIGVLAGTSQFNVKVVYDYSIEATVLPPNLVPGQGNNLWDSAVWDTNAWDFGVEGQSFPVGVLGLGRTVAVAMRGNANTRINIVGWDIMYTRGGYL